jgi:hypothetical protein
VLARLKAAPNTNGHPNDETGSTPSPFSPFYTPFRHPPTPLPTPTKHPPKSDPNPPKTPWRLCASACAFFPLQPHRQNRLPYASRPRFPSHQTKQSRAVNLIHPGDRCHYPVGREGAGVAEVPAEGQCVPRKGSDVGPVGRWGRRVIQRGRSGLGRRLAWEGSAGPRQKGTRGGAEAQREDGEPF